METRTANCCMSKHPPTSRRLECVERITPNGKAGDSSHQNEPVSFGGTAQEDIAGFPFVLHKFLPKILAAGFCPSNLPAAIFRASLAVLKTHLVSDLSG